jgi:hypoxanthine phosphoribosyltransferase
MFMESKIRCELISWNGMYQLARRLALNIKKVRFKPDIVVAIARGGFVPARILCDFLDIGNLTSLRVVHYTGGAYRQKRARLTESLGVDVRGMKVLVVDDVSDTGDTLKITRLHLDSFAPAQVRFAVLHHKMVSSVEPDYYAKKVVKWRWIIYPWAVYEDVTGFLSAMENPPGSPDEAARRLERDYSIKVPVRVLADIYDLPG